MSTSHKAVDLDAIGTEIEKLEAEHIDAQRRAGDLVGDDLAAQLAEAEALIAKLRLDMRYRLYFRVSREARRRKVCERHGADELIVACSDCREAWGYESSLIRDLASTRAAVAVGDAHGVEPRTTLRILEASKRTGT